VKNILSDIENISKTDLIELLKNQAYENVKLEDKNVKLELHSKELESKIADLTFQLEQFKRAMFGSKRERFIASENVEQLPIPFEVDQKQVLEAVEKVVEQITYERTKAKAKNHPGRLELPSNLPVKEIIIEPTQNVEGLKCIGKEITDELEYTPAKLYINRYIRNKYITQEDENGKQEVKIANLNFRPINKCIAGAHLLAQIVLDKYIDHLPVYRQLQRFQRDGVTIASSTIESWQRLIAPLLHPLYECHKQYCIRDGYLQVDESPLKVQDKDKKGACHPGYMWVYHAPIHKSVYFDYRKGRSSEGPLELLSTFEGYLQTDGYGVYEQFGRKEKIIHIGCWAHSRRMFEKSLDYDKVKASHFLILIQQLYLIERQAKEEKLSGKNRYKLRLEKSLPILNQIGKLLAIESKIVLPKTPLGKAIGYCLNRWDSMLDYLKDGNIEIDNNLVENAIRPLVLGRKNYLFAGSHEAAKNIAMYYSFFSTCKKLDIHPQKWLVYVLTNINITDINQLKTLLPQFIDKSLLD
jgi:transposase